MKSQLKSKSRVGRGIRRIARKEMCAIAEHLREGRRSDDGGRSLHEARKHLKKIRALLRLVRAELGGRTYRKENRSFRDIARVLSPRRDAEVLVKTLEKLRRHPTPGLKVGLLKLDKVLLGRHQQAFETGDCNQDLGPALKAARRRAGHWPLGKVGWSDLICGLRRSYRCGRQALKQVEPVRTNENLHEWRKRVKDLWYQLHLIEPVCPKGIAGLAAEMEKLGDYLGEDHDLTMLEAVAKRAGLAPTEARSISDWIEMQRRPLQAAAFESGRRLFAEKPGCFARRIRDSSKTGRGK
jgi:CHAD domain-containing protein